MSSGLTSSFGGRFGVGILLSFKIDLPTGATIVVTFGVVLLLMAIVRLFTRIGGTQAA